MARVRGIIVVFHLPEGSPPSRHRQFRRRVYGEETSSWGGKYHYRRSGLLDGIPHVRLYWGTVLVGEEDGRRLVRAIRAEDGVVEVRRVELTTKDWRVLVASRDPG